MIKYTLIVLTSLCFFNIVVHANPLTERNTKANHKEETGLGIGAIIGGLIAGPPGAIIGAAGGAWFGNKEKREDEKTTQLENTLIEKQSELAYLQDEFARLNNAHGQALHKVKSESRTHDLQDLSNAVSLSVYFRTNSADIDANRAAGIQKLATYLNKFPEIQIQLDAYADRRGSESYNRELSRTRADAIKRELIKAGLQSSRIRSNAYGESLAQSAEGDDEGYVFDRRVTVSLSLGSDI